MIEKLTSYQLTQIINDAEKRIIAAKVKTQDLKPQVDDYKQAYEKLRDEYLEIERTIVEDTNLLDVATKEKNGIADGKKFKLIRGTSHNDMKDKEKQKLKSTVKHVFKWTRYAVNALTAHGHWMRTEELFNLICEINHVRKIAKEKDLIMSKLKYACIQTCWVANDKYTRAGSDYGKIIIVGDKVGLKEWVDSNFKVVAV